MIGRTNAGGGGGVKTVTGTVSFTKYSTSSANYYAHCAVIPASLIGFKPKMVLLGITSDTALSAYSVDEKTLYGGLVCDTAVYPDGTATKFTETNVLQKSGENTSVDYITLGGTEYAYVPNTSRKVAWFHSDGSVRLAFGTMLSAGATEDMTYILCG